MAAGEGLKRLVYDDHRIGPGKCVACIALLVFEQRPTTAPPETGTQIVTLCVKRDDVWDAQLLLHPRRKIARQSIRPI